MTSLPSVYPETQAARDEWIVQRRGKRVPVEADRPHAFLVEQERFADGEVGEVATIFLTNRECPWRCAMCDLWRHTLPSPVAPGDIPRQIEFALARLPRARQIKLYNSGSFFDAGAIPPADDLSIAALLRSFDRVIVESHPALVGDRCLRFCDLLHSPLEVAMGLETAHSGVLEKLNKRMTLKDYAAAAHRLRSHGISLRSFVLVQPPFMAERDALEWSCRSIDFAQECGATVVTLIPTRSGNGAVDELAQLGAFAPPHLAMLEQALEYGLRRGAGRVFADLWDGAGIPCCPMCKAQRLARLQRMNLTQRVETAVSCVSCGDRK